MRTKKISDEAAKPAVITAHLVFHSHLDPVWLWPWETGLDAGLATYRSACDRLDEYPELKFGHGDAWLLEKTEQADPKLFARIKAFVESGRWSLFGGWFVEPDCNFISDKSYERQIELGREYLMSRFGKFTDIARNVDAFGHSAAIPGIMRAAGQTRYIFSRPPEQDSKYPARIFKWRGYKGGPEVLAFKLAGYGTTGGMSEDHFRSHIKNAGTMLPEGVTDTMVFLGIGDHGGGPTKKIVEHCIRLKNDIPGFKLVFSHPEEFFEIIEKNKKAVIPELTGDLQSHAIGCYNIQRSLKTKVRKAENLLEQAALSAEKFGDKTAAPKLREAWKAVCFQPISRHALRHLYTVRLRGRGGADRRRARGRRRDIETQFQAQFRSRQKRCLSAPYDLQRVKEAVSTALIEFDPLHRASSEMDEPDQVQMAFAG